MIKAVVVVWAAYITAILIVLFSFCRAHASGCNQRAYDMIYERVIQQALASDLNQGAIERKNTTIQQLRYLCNGQLSTFERKNKYEQLYKRKRNRQNQKAH